MAITKAPNERVLKSRKPLCSIVMDYVAHIAVKIVSDCFSNSGDTSTHRPRHNNLPYKDR